MANPALFKSVAGTRLPPGDGINEAGGRAYRFEPRQALAQYAATGCLNSTYYASAETQLRQVLELCRLVEPVFIAQTAIYTHTQSKMRDLPALLAAVLSLRDRNLLAQVFNRIMDTLRMIRNFVQIIRSGLVGRKSLGTLPKRLIQRWLETRNEEQLFFGSVGQAPSLADVIKIVHPRPQTAARQALYAYLIGHAPDETALPEVIRQFEVYKAAPDRQKLKLPDVPFQMLTALNLGRKEWIEIARHASWQTLRMNLNTFHRHGVFEEPGMAEQIARRLADKDEVIRAKVLPYQLLVAYQNLFRDAPGVLREALQDALEFSLQNVPAVTNRVCVLPDVSGSMQSPITGVRHGASSAVRCVDVAALVAAALLRKNPMTQVIPFSDEVHDLVLNPRDTVLTNAQKLAGLPGGGTNASAPLARLNRNQVQADLVIYVSDNQSWLDTPHGTSAAVAPTETMRQWQAFKERNPNARLICLDLQPNAHTQAVERADVFNVGGFSDQVFDLFAAVARGEPHCGYWVSRIEEVLL